MLKISVIYLINFADPPEDLDLSVSSPATHYDDDDDYGIKEGEDLTVDCAAGDASPLEVTYTWTKEGGGFPPQDSSTLTISNIQRNQHDGTYKCTASNEMPPTDTGPETGTESETVTITVECKYSDFLC